MKLFRKNNSLSALSLEVPTLSADQEGLLKGGFCSITTAEDEAGLLAVNTGCNVDCKKGCVATCKHACNVDCNDSCDVRCTAPDGTENRMAANADSALVGFSLVF